MTNQVGDVVNGMTATAGDTLVNTVTNELKDTAENALFFGTHTISDAAKADHETLYTSGGSVERHMADDMLQSLNAQSAVFVNPDAINVTMAGTADVINDIVSSGQEIAGVNDNLDGFWIAPEAANFKSSLGSFLEVLNNYQTSNENISQTASNISNLYSTAEEFHKLAVSSQMTGSAPGVSSGGLRTTAQTK